MSSIYKYLKKHCYTLSATAILELYKKDNISFKPLFTKQKKECFTIQVFKQNKYNLLYVNNEDQLSGLCLELSTRQSIETRTTLQLEFCKVIAKHYWKVNFLESFNHFQLQCCLEFKKYGFNTFTESFESYSSKIAPKQLYKKKKTLVFPKIDMSAFYKWYFDTNKVLVKGTKNSSVIYLLYCNQSSFIKICETTVSRFDKGQILLSNPNCDMIAYWKAPSWEESKLTHIFKKKEQTNYWYHFSFDDLQIIKNRINTYSPFGISNQKYRRAI